MSDLFSHAVTLRLGVKSPFLQASLAWLLHSTFCLLFVNLHSFQFMAASTPASKRMRMASPTNVVSNQKALDIIHSAQALPFPWKEAVPERISDWFHIVAKSHNTAPPSFCSVVVSQQLPLSWAHSHQ